MKLPIKAGAIALGTGVVAYLGGVQVQKNSTWAAQHWYAVPGILAAVGLVVASKKKSEMVGLGAIGAAGAIGYFAYAAAKGQPTMQASTAASTPATTTQTTSQVQPASQTTPLPSTGTPAATTPASTASTDQSGIGGAAQQVADTFGGSGTTPGAADTTGGAADGSTQTSGYGANAGALGGRRAFGMQRHAGAFMPNRRIQPVNRHAGNYASGDAAGLET